MTAAPSGTGWRTGTAVPGSTVSVGSATLNRRITNLADGAAESDAVTVRQLQTTTSDLGTALTSALGGAATYDPSTGIFVPPTYEIGDGTYNNVFDALEAQEAIVSTLGTTASESFNSTASALGGGSTYDPATGTISMPVYTVDDGTGAATTDVSGVGGAVDNLDTRITAIQTGAAGLVQQLGADGATVDPSAPITVGGNTGGSQVNFANDIGEARRLSGVANATDAGDAVNLSQLLSAISAVEFAEGIYFQVNPGPDPDNPAGGALAGGNLSTASGPEVVVSGDYGFGAGYQATVENDAESGVAIGHGARSGSDAATSPADPAAAVAAVAIGRNAHAGHAASVALGSESSTARGALSDYSAFGLGFTLQNSVGEVSIGSAGAERQITNVAAGSEATDAVNLAQLQGAAQTLGESLELALGGGAAYDPATGSIFPPSYFVDDGTGSGVAIGWNSVGEAVDALDDNIVAIRTGAAGLVQQMGTGGFVDPTAPLTIGAATGGNQIIVSGVNAAGDQVLRRISGVLNPLEATDAATMGWVQSALESFAVSAQRFFHANPDELDPAASDSVAAGSHAVAIGPNTVVNADAGIGMGDGVSIATLATDGIGIGRAATLTENAAQSMALGADTVANHANSVALGAGAATTVGALADYDAFGLAGAPQSSIGELAIGTSTGQRQITGLAAGLADYDAVNVLQMRGVARTLGESIADAFGGTASYDEATGAVTLPTYEIEGQPAVGVDGAIQNLFGRTETNENEIAALADPDTGRVSIAENNIDDLIAGRAGLVQQSDASAIEPITVGGHTGGNIVDFTNANDAARTLVGVAAGELSETSTEAVSGSQLYATNQLVTANVADIDYTRQNLIEGLGGNAHYDGTGSFVAPQYVFAADGTYLTESQHSNVGDALADLDARTRGSMAALGGGATYNYATGTYTAPTFTVGTADYSTVGDALTAQDGIVTEQGTTTAAALGGGSTYDPATGTVSMPIYTVGDGAGGTTTATGVEGAITNIDGRVVTAESSISDLQDAIGEGTVGLVQQDATTRTITVAAGTDGDLVNFSNNAGDARVLTGVADGEISDTSLDAINGSQLFATRQGMGSIADALGGGAAYDPATGAFTQPTYTVGDGAGGTTTVNNLGDVVTNIDGRVVTAESSISDLQDAIGEGTVGLVQQDATTRTITVAAGTDGDLVDFTNNAGDARVLTGVAPGEISASSLDAVNGSQLFATRQGIQSIADVLGGGAAYDPISETFDAPIFTVGTVGYLTIAAAITAQDDIVTLQGNTTAAALGGGSTYNAATGAVSMPTYTVGDGAGGTTSVAGVEGIVDNFNQRTIANETSISGLEDAISGGTVGLVQQDSASRVITVAAGTDGSIVDFTGSDGVRRLVGVAAGVDDTDAVNVGQMAGRLADVYNQLQEDLATGVRELAYFQADSGATAPDDPVHPAAAADGAFSVAVGQSALATTDATRGIALGAGAVVSQIDSVALGAGSITDRGPMPSYTAFGLTGTQASIGEVSIGTADGQRQITGVAAGSEDTDAVNVAQLRGVSDTLGDAITNIDGRVTVIGSRVDDIQQQINDGGIGIVRQDPSTNEITVGANTGGDTVNMEGTDGHRRVTGVADGEIAAGSTDAVTGSQIHNANQSIASALGGDSVVAADGSITAPSYQVAGNTYNDVGSAFGAIQNQIDNLETSGSEFVGVNSTRPAAAATGSESTAIGGGSVASGSDSSAFGSGSQATGGNSTAIGAGASAGHNNATAIGAGATTSRDNQVVVGNASNTYTMPGITSDASRAAQSGPLQIVTSDANGNLGTVDVGNFFNDVEDMGRRLDRASEGVAMAIALGGTHLPPGRDFAVSMNFGSFDGHGALGFGAIGHVRDNLYINGALGVGFSTGAVAGRIGATLAW